VGIPRFKTTPILVGYFRNLAVNFVHIYSQTFFAYLPKPLERRGILQVNCSMAKPALDPLLQTLDDIDARRGSNHRDGGFT
jgi:hypothetical protein